MAKRAGKYKLTKRDSATSLIDGGNATGAITGVYNKVQNINAATNLTDLDCGFITLGTAVAGTQGTGTGFNVNLPAPKEGLYFHFTLRPAAIANNANAAITVTATSDGSTAADIAIGSVTVNGAPTNVTSGVDILTFVHNAATGGDYAYCYCDGTNWFFVAFGDAAGSVTLA
tara:strand:+ start:217 stop:732 length:516 start_codon:yes stop_codon:yes gene_type:complete